jgi:hypothetical protein
LSRLQISGKSAVSLLYKFAGFPAWYFGHVWRMRPLFLQLSPCFEGLQVSISGLGDRARSAKYVESFAKQDDSFLETSGSGFAIDMGRF